MANLKQSLHKLSESNFLCVFICLFVCLSVALQISHFRRPNKVLVESLSTGIFKNLNCSLFFEALKMLSLGQKLHQIYFLKFLYVVAPVRNSPASIRISQDIWCLRYARFFVMKLFLDEKIILS